MDRVERVPAGRLNLLFDVEVGGERHYLQRCESANRIRTLREEWDDTLVGVLQVHILVDHPTEPGIWHVGEGGCRLRAKTDVEATGLEAEPGYEFLCVIEEVAVRESARRFIGQNKYRKAVPKLDEYRVALTAQEPWALAIRDGLHRHGLEINRFPRYGNGAAGHVAAVAGCEYAVLQAYRAYADWWLASGHLAGVLEITRRGFAPVTGTEREEAAYAHDGDLIRAVSRIILRNAEKMAGVRNQQRLSDKLGMHSASWWKSTSQELSTSRGATPGSGGRPGYLAGLIVWEFNKRLSEERRLTSPSRVVIE